MVNDFPLKFFPRFAYEQFIKPQYDGYNFGNIHATIRHLFGHPNGQPILPVDCFGQEYPQPHVVVLFFLDAFGWQFWQDESIQPAALVKIKEEGRVTPLTTLFPSTTASSLTTLHTGQLPAQHALYEWNLLIPEYDEVIQTLIFAPLGERLQDQLLATKHDPNVLFNQGETLVGALAKDGVKTIQVIPRDYSQSAYNQLIGKGDSPAQPYRNLNEAFGQIKESTRLAKGPTFIYFYYGDIDNTMHTYGPQSSEARTKITQFWQVWDEAFSQWNKPADTLFLFTADHGQIALNPDKAIYLNRLVPELIPWLRTHRNGQPIMPNGSPRDVFLHIQPERVEEALNLLRTKLDLKALVMTTTEAREQGLFGRGPFDQHFLDRLGQILILPYEQNQIWWYDPPRLYAKHRGSHGGLSPEEALTVFATW